MEFNIFNQKKQLKMYLLPLIIPAMIMGIYFAVYFAVPPEQRGGDMLIVMWVFAWMSMFLLLVIYLSYFYTYGAKKHKISLNEEGITYISTKNSFTVKWEGIGIVRAAADSKISFIYFFNKSLTIHQCRQYVGKGANVKKINEEFVFVQYYKEFYDELMKYYPGDVVNEYSLAIIGEL